LPNEKSAFFGERVTIEQDNIQSGTAMKIVVTSIVRRSKKGESSGSVTTVDIEKGAVNRTCCIPEPRFVRVDINPRGGLRGGKGIALLNGRICIANASEILLYDHHWELKDVITHPSCASVHEILARDDALWAASTRNDLILEFDRDGHIVSYFNYRDHSEVVSALGLTHSQIGGIDRDMILSGSCDFRDPRTHRLDQVNRAHVNSMCFLSNGDMLVSLGCLTQHKMAFLMQLKGYLTKARIYPVIVSVNQILIKLLGLRKQKNSSLAFVPATASSAILRVTPDGTCLIPFQFSDTTVPNHSLCPLTNGHVLYCDTNSGKLLVLDPDSGTVLKSIFVAEDFLRGIEPLTQTLIAVGSQHTVHIVDIERDTVVKKVQISDDPRVAIFDIHVLPDDVDPLPDKLAGDSHCD
jgi:hypothetical protein